MRERIPDRNVWLIFGAIFLLGLAYGVSISLVALFLDARGFTKGDIGELAAWFASGIVALSLPMGALIRRFSARACLVGALIGYALAVGAFPFVGSYEGIAAVRFLDGAFSVGVWVSCETILLSRAEKKNKAFVTSLYAIAMACGYVVGPFLAKVIVGLATMHHAFVASAIIAIAAAALVLLRLDSDVREAGPEAALGQAPHPSGAVNEVGAASTAVSTAAPTPALTLLWRIKTSCLATFSYGYFQASVVLFLPLYLVEKKGITKEQTILIPAFFATGMLLFSNVAGRLGDRFGHLGTMRVLGSVGTAMILGFVFLDAYAAMCVAVFIAGASLASISPVSLALQGVIAEPRDYARSNALYNVFYAAGMLLGPYASSRIYDGPGGEAMLYHLAAMWTGFVVFTVIFFRDDPRARGTVPLVAASQPEA